MTTGEPLVVVERLGKKFCRSLRRSLWYGMVDVAGELGLGKPRPELRKKEFWAVHDVSFDLHRGETIGLIGPNGAGKSTVLRLLNGIIKPDMGRIEVRGRMQALIALGAGFNPVLTGRENIYVAGSVLGMRKAEIDRRFDEIIAFSGIAEFIDTPVQSYSSGMVVRLGFAVAAHVEPDILLVDEVLAVGDLGFQSRCLNKIGELKGAGAGIVLVSHNMHTISSYANRVIVLSEGRHQSFASVHDGIQAYRRLFQEVGDGDIQRIRSGNDMITFHDVKVSETQLSPGASFTIELGYRSSTTYRDVEVDLALYSSNEPGLHFQATNKAYGAQVDLQAGEHCLKITFHDLRINGGSAVITCTVWSHDRTEQLFWWRIPALFSGVAGSTGNNFVDITYDPVR